MESTTPVIKFGYTSKGDVILNYALSVDGTLYYGDQDSNLEPRPLKDGDHLPPMFSLKEVGESDLRDILMGFESFGGLRFYGPPPSIEAFTWRDLEFSPKDYYVHIPWTIGAWMTAWQRYLKVDSRAEMPDPYAQRLSAAKVYLTDDRRWWVEPTWVTDRWQWRACGTIGGHGFLRFGQQFGYERTSAIGKGETAQDALEDTFTKLKAEVEKLRTEADAWLASNLG